MTSRPVPCCGDCGVAIDRSVTFAMAARSDLVRGRIGYPSDEITGRTQPRVEWRCGACLATLGPLK